MSLRASWFTLILVLILCPGVVFAQNKKKTVNSAADLPRFSYEVPEKLTDLLTEDAAFAILAVKIRSNLEGVLRDYDIQDKSTLKQIHLVLSNLDFEEGRFESAFQRYRLINDLEEKPDLKYLPDFFELELIARARQRSGVDAGEKFLVSFRAILAETLNSFPDSIFTGVKEFGAAYGFFKDSFAVGMVESQLAPRATKGGNRLFNDDIYRITGLRVVHRFVLPLTAELEKGFGDYIASHKPVEKVNIWTSRNVTLDDRRTLTPVVAAVWDTGVDPTVYPNQMFVNIREKVNGKDNDGNGFVGDIHGIGFDLRGRFTAEPLLAIRDSDVARYAGWAKERRIFAKLEDDVDDDETRELKQKIRAQTPDKLGEENRLQSLFGHYSHGTQVGSIIVDGNPAVRILSARSTWRDNKDADSLFFSQEWAHGFAANIKNFVNYFKKHRVRVVNMSWSMARKDFETDYEKYEPDMSPAERKKRAEAAYRTVRKAMTDAFGGAPEILFTCSAGNTDSDAQFNETLPNTLRLPNIIAVGAVDARGTAASFTSFGSNVSLYAQGVSVPTLAPGGETVMFGGTSAAAPAVASLAAKLFALDPSLTVARVIRLIQDGAEISEVDKRLKLINPKRSIEMSLQKR